MFKALKEFFTCQYNIGGVPHNERIRRQNAIDDYVKSQDYVYYCNEANEILLLKQPNINKTNMFIKVNNYNVKLEKIDVIYLGEL